MKQQQELFVGLLAVGKGRNAPAKMGDEGVMLERARDGRVMCQVGAQSLADPQTPPSLCTALKGT